MACLYQHITSLLKNPFIKNFSLVNQKGQERPTKAGSAMLCFFSVAKYFHLVTILERSRKVLKERQGVEFHVLWETLQ